MGCCWCMTTTGAKGACACSGVTAVAGTAAGSEAWVAKYRPNVYRSKRARRENETTGNPLELLLARLALLLSLKEVAEQHRLRRLPDRIGSGTGLHPELELEFELLILAVFISRCLLPRSADSIMVMWLIQSIFEEHVMHRRFRPRFDASARWIYLSIDRSNIYEGPLARSNKSQKKKRFLPLFRMKASQASCSRDTSPRLSD
jgi:hypothetical protein